MTTGHPVDEVLWYVMRAYKSERRAVEMLSSQRGLPHFVARRPAVRSLGGRKTVSYEPVIPSLVFVRASQRQIVDFKQNVYNQLQFVTWKNADNVTYLTVPDRQMDDFIAVCEQREKEVIFHRPGEVEIERGRRVRVHGGPFDKVEGVFVKMVHRRNRRLVVILPGVIAASVEISPDFLEIID